MDANTLTGLIFGAIIIMPSIVIIEATLREGKDDEKDVIKLRFNISETIFYALLYGFLFILGSAFIMFPFIMPKTGWLSVIFIPFGCVLMINLVLFVDHFLFEITRTVTIDKKNKTITIKRYSKKIFIDLLKDDHKVIRFAPKYLGNNRAQPPGANFGKTIIIIEDKKYEFSNMLFDQKFFRQLGLDSKSMIVKQQINWVSGI